MAKRSRSKKTQAKPSASPDPALGRPLGLDDLHYAYDPKLPTLWVDNMRISLRTDGLGTLSFFQSMPGSEIDRVEVARIITNVKHLSQMATVLNKVVSGYYPDDFAKGSEA